MSQGIREHEAGGLYMNSHPGANRMISRNCFNISIERGWGGVKERRKGRREIEGD